MAKIERITMYNKGRRIWPLNDCGKEVSLSPGKTIELEKALAEKLVANYPLEFIIGGKPEAETTAEIKAYKKTILDLTNEVEILKKEITALKEVK